MTRVRTIFINILARWLPLGSRTENTAGFADVSLSRDPELMLPVSPRTGAFAPAEGSSRAPVARSKEWGKPHSDGGGRTAERDRAPSGVAGVTRKLFTVGDCARSRLASQPVWCVGGRGPSAAQGAKDRLQTRTVECMQR